MDLQQLVTWGLRISAAHLEPLASNSMLEKMAMKPACRMPQELQRGLHAACGKGKGCSGKEGACAAAP